MSTTTIPVTNCWDCFYCRYTMDGYECVHPDRADGPTFVQGNTAPPVECPLRANPATIEVRLANKEQGNEQV